MMSLLLLQGKGLAKPGRKVQLFLAENSSFKMQGDTAISVMDCDKSGRLKILRRDAVTASGCNTCPFSCSASIFCKEKSSFYKSS